MQDSGSFQIRTRIIFGSGSSENVAAALDEMSVRNVLLVTGPTLMKQGIVDRIARLIAASGRSATLFAEVEPEPSADTIGKGAEMLRKSGADGVVALGGGSNLDAAKAIAVVAANGGKATDYEGVDAFEKGPLPIVALPTTAGTASEVTYFSVITDKESDRKFIISSPRIAPKVAILDPTLCATAPKQVVVSAGMDALTHAVESYTSKLATPFTQANAIYAVRMIAENLRAAVANPANEAAMGRMLMASCIAGIAFTNSRLGIVHAIALPVGARSGGAHGISNAILLPYGMQYNAVAVPELYADIAQAMGLETCGYSRMEAANTAIEMVQALAEDIGAPRALREIGAREEHFPDMAKDAMRSGHVQVNPRPFTASDVEAIYHAAY